MNNIYIVSDTHQELSSVNICKSRIYTKDGFINHFKNLLYKASVTVAIVNEDGTDGNCNFQVGDMNELINRIGASGEWHIIRDSGEEVPDLYNLIQREDEYQRYEHLYVYMMSVN